MSTLDKLLAIQENRDDSLANTGNLRRLIKTATKARNIACLSGPPEFGDVSSQYYSYIEATYKPFVSVLSQYVRTNLQQKDISQGTLLECAFDTGNSTFIGDLMVMVQFPQVTLSSLTVVPGMTIQPIPGYGRIRYCAYPGLRLFSQVNMVINGKIVEQYNPNNAIDFFFHELDVNKRETFARCVGQQQLQLAPYSWAFDQYQNPIVPDKQLYTYYSDGPQTPRNVQPPLTMAIPLLFNWVRDNEIAISTDYMNINVRSVQFQVVPMSQIVSHYADAPIAVPSAGFTFTAASVYARSIFMNTEVASLFTRKQRYMVRTWRTYTQPYTAAAPNAPGQFSLDAVKFPVECMYVKFIPNINATEASTLSGANIPSYDYWYIGAQITKSSLPISVMSTNATTGAVFQNSISYQFGSMADVVQNIDLSVQEVDLYDGAIDTTTAGQYLPVVESSIQRGAPYPGTYVFSFSQRYKGDFSRTAAGYMDFTLFGDKNLTFGSNIISPAFPVTMIISVKCLNFIDITELGLVTYMFPAT
jgi:hypothetical protein